MLESVASPLIVISPDGKIAFANADAHRLLGLDSANSLTGQSISDLLIGQRPCPIIADWNQLKQQSELACVEYFLCPGQPKRIQLKAHWRVIADTECAVCYLHGFDSEFDTWRESLARVTFDQSDDLIYVVDQFANVIEMNEGGCKALGYSRDHLLGQKVALFNPNYAPDRLQKLQQQIDETGSVRFESVRVRNDGSRFPVEVSASVLRLHDQRFYFVVAKDITIKKRIEEDLTYTQSMIDSCPDPVYWFDQSGRLVFANNASCETLGYSSAELSELFVADIESEYSVERFKLLVGQLLDKGQASFETRLRNRNGDTLDVDVAVSAHEIDGELVFCAFASDITDKNRIARQTRQFADQMAESNRQSSLSALAATIAHELNQPLTSISTNAYVLQQLVTDQNQNDPDNLIVTKLQTLAKDIMSEALSAGEMIHRLRGLVVQQQAETAVVDLVSVATRAIQFLEPQLREMSIAVDFQHPSKPLLVKVNPLQIQQVLVNLTTNSLKAMQAVPETDRKLTLTLDHAEPGLIRMSVRDSGTGVPAADQEQLFQPLFTTQSSESGIGLGLSMSLTIARNHGGSLELNPDYANGAEFRLHLPAVESQDELDS